MSDGLSDLVIADPGGGNRRRIAGSSDLLVSWDIHQAGLLSATVTLTNLQAAGVNLVTLIGQWVSYEHPTAGPWGGVVTQRDIGAEVVTIGAESWLGMLRGYITQTDAETGTLGDYVRRELMAARYRGLRLRLPTEWPNVTWASSGNRGLDLYEGLMPLVVSQAAKDDHLRAVLTDPFWYVDPAVDPPTLSVTQRARNRTASVRLSSGEQVADYHWADDLIDLWNVVELNAPVQERVKVGRRVDHHLRPDRAVGADDASIAAVGRREISVDEPRLIFNSHADLVDFAATMARAWARPYAAATLMVVESVNQQGENLAQFARFREGDLVSVDLGGGDVRGVLRVEVRALDVARGEMTVSGTGLAA